MIIGDAKGFFLLLNLKSVDSIGKRYPKGNTLFTCIFENKFKSFDEYLLSLRSNYRRRISIAQKRGKALIIVFMNTTCYAGGSKKLIAMSR